MTAVYSMTGDGQTSLFMQNLTSYYCLRRPELLNNVQEHGRQPIIRLPYPRSDGNSVSIGA